MAKLAAQMRPGEWAVLKTEELNRSVLSSSKPGTGMNLMGWSDDAHWDSKTGQFLFHGPEANAADLVTNA